MCYKQYQQVLNLTVKPKAAKSLSVEKSTKTASGKTLATPVKRRTKTGCLTCRKRKKKCDEDKVDGKCQACTRNFLECCWPEPATTTPNAVKTETKLVECTKGLDAYPSPVMSPLQDSKKELDEVCTLSLPPNKYKISKPVIKKEKIASISASNAKFIITSFDSDKALCQVPI